MFRERIGVVVEGTMTRAGHFEGHRLMVSHGNEYRAPERGRERGDRPADAQRPRGDGAPAARTRAATPPGRTRDRRARPQPRPARAAACRRSARSVAVGDRRARARRRAGPGRAGCAYLFAASMIAANLLMVCALLAPRLQRQLRGPGGLARRAELGRGRQPVVLARGVDPVLGSRDRRATSALATWANRDQHPEYMPWAIGRLARVRRLLRLPARGSGAAVRRRCSRCPPDGPGPNPLLQNHLLMVDPPAVPLPRATWA